MSFLGHCSSSPSQYLGTALTAPSANYAASCVLCHQQLCNACVSDRFYAGPVQSNASFESVPYISQPHIPRWLPKHKPRLILRWQFHLHIPPPLHFSHNLRMVLAIAHTLPHPTFPPTSDNPSIATFE